MDKHDLTICGICGMTYQKNKPHYCNTNTSGIYTWPEINKTSPKNYMWDIPVEMKPSDLEMKIRKEVMAAVDEMYGGFVTNHIDSMMKEQADSLLTKIKDRLNLLWGE